MEIYTGSSESNDTNSSDFDFVPEEMNNQLDKKIDKDASKELSLLLTSKIGFSAGQVTQVLNEVAPECAKLTPISEKTIRRFWCLLRPLLLRQLEDFILSSKTLILGSDGSSVNGYVIFAFILQNEKNEFFGYDFLQLRNEKVPTVLEAFKKRFSDLSEKSQYSLAAKAQEIDFLKN